MFILMTTFTAYAYALPYKEMSVNIVELLFQLSLLLFLLLRSTRSIVDEFLKFPDHQHSDNDPKRCSNETGTGYLTWILFPFACLPLVVIMGIFSTKVTIRLWWGFNSITNYAYITTYIQMYIILATACCDNKFSESALTVWASSRFQIVRLSINAL